MHNLGGTGGLQPVRVFQHRFDEPTSHPFSNHPLVGVGPQSEFFGVVSVGGAGRPYFVQRFLQKIQGDSSSLREWCSAAACWWGTGPRGGLHARSCDSRTFCRRITPHSTDECHPPRCISFRPGPVLRAAPAPRCAPPAKILRGPGQNAVWCTESACQAGPEHPGRESRPEGVRNIPRTAFPTWPLAAAWAISSKNPGSCFSSQDKRGPL